MNSCGSRFVRQLRLRVVVAAAGTLLITSAPAQNVNTTFPGAAAGATLGTSVLNQQVTPLAGDFNGDGKGDYALIGTTSVDTYLSNGDGTFTDVTYSYPGGWAFGSPPGASWTLVAGDFNGDGKTDFALVQNSTAHTFLSNGNGTFTGGSYLIPNGWNFGSPPSSAWTLIAGDFNADGKTDFAFAQNSALYTFLSNGDGTFVPGTFSLGQSFGSPPTAAFTLLTGDMNDDGKADFAFASRSAIYGFFSKGDGTLTATTYNIPAALQPAGFAKGCGIHVDLSNSCAAPPPSPYTAFAGDLNGDHKTDLAYVTSTQIFAYFSQGDGTFTPTVYNIGGGWAFGNPPGASWTPIVGDFNNDGKVDLAFLQDSTLHTFLSSGTGSFTQGTYTAPNGWSFGAPPTATYALITGYFDGVNGTDFLLFYDGVYYSFLSSGNGGFNASAASNTVPITFETSPGGLAYSVDGMSFTSAQTPAFVAGSTHSISVNSPQTSGGFQNTFSSWSDGGAQTHKIAANAAESITASFTVKQTPPTLQSIAVTPISPSIVEGSILQFAATGTYSDGSSQNITSSAIWASAVPAVATINASGLVTGASAGVGNITASLSGVISAPDLLTVTSSLAAYIGLDTTTQGTWTGVYGTGGQIIANDTASPPAYATVRLTNDSAYTWAASTSDARALQTSGGASARIASTFYAYTSFTIDVDLTDGNPHRVSLYLLDWDSTTRSESIAILDAATSAVLSTQVFSGFHNGAYAVWNLQGHVRIQVTRTGGSNAVVSAIFFDPIPSASYSGLDSTTQGTWTGNYGSNGQIIANDAENLPAFAAVGFTGDLTATWGYTNDVRALQTARGASTRIASTFFSASAFTINLNLTDGNSHKISLYLLDWDSAARTETVSILDAVNNAVLSTQSFAGFHGGEYAIWSINGRVLIQVTRTGGWNAVVAGLFLD